MGKYKTFAESDPLTIVLGESSKKDQKHNRYVFVLCPSCEKEREIRKNKLNVYGHTYCFPCAITADLRGIRFGRLIALKYYPDKKEWLCRCDCGNDTLVNKTSLISTRGTRSCGCLKTRSGGDNPVYKSMIGEKYGKLTVIGYIGGNGYKRLCKCECGRIVKVSGGALQSGNSKSCGCFNLEQIQARMQGEQNPSWNPALTDKEREERKLGRRDRKYIKFKTGVASRDGYACKVCGTKKEKLEVHHLYSYTKHKEHRRNPQFAITLCKKCHREFHRWMGGNRVPCTPDDFLHWRNCK